MDAYRKWVTPLGCLFLAAVMAGCYESSHPLSKAGQVRYDVALVGSWRCVPDTTENSGDRAVLEVLPFDDFQYYVEWREQQEITRYRAYGVRLNKSVLLNVRELRQGAPAGKWVFVRYRLEGTGKLKLAVVSEKALRGRDEAEHLRDIRSRAADDTLYEPFAVCVRAEK